MIGEYERAFYGGQCASMGPLFEHYRIQLRTPEVGGRIDFHAEDGKQAFAGSSGLPGSVRAPHDLWPLCRYSIAYDRCVAVGGPHAASSRKYAAGTSTTPSASISRYGSNKSPVASSDPPSDTASRDRSRGPYPSVIMVRDRSHQDSHPSADLKNLSP